MCALVVKSLVSGTASAVPRHGRAFSRGPGPAGCRNSLHDRVAAGITFSPEETMADAVQIYGKST